jgi:hypothetical protein
MKEIVSPIWVSSYSPQRAVAVPLGTLCCVEHTFYSYESMIRSSPRPG